MAVRVVRGRPPPRFVTQTSWGSVGGFGPWVHRSESHSWEDLAMIDIDQGLGPVACPALPGAALTAESRQTAQAWHMGDASCNRHYAKDIRFADAEGTIAPAMTGHAAMQLGAAAILVLVTLSASGARAQTSLPDASRTPGAINLSVTQKTIGETICVRGWTHMVRPPVGYTVEAPTDRCVRLSRPEAEPLRGGSPDPVGAGRRSVRSAEPLAQAEDTARRLGSGP